MFLLCIPVCEINDSKDLAMWRCCFRQYPCTCNETSVMVLALWISDYNLSQHFVDHFFFPLTN